jgi:hypothetical protein
MNLERRREREKRRGAPTSKKEVSVLGRQDTITLWGSKKK